MNLIIIGTEHTLQGSDVCLKDFIARITESEQAKLIGEEYAPNSVAHRVADSKGITWIGIDMNPEQRRKAGIDEKLINRMQIRYEADGTVVQRLRYAPKEDGIREEFWLDRIAEEQTEGTALLVCGALHARKVSEKAKQKGLSHQIVFPPRNSGIAVLGINNT